MVELTGLRLLVSLYPCHWIQVVTLAWVMASSRGPSPRRDFVKLLAPALLAAIRLTVACKLPSKPHAMTTPSAMPLDADMQPQLQQSASAPFPTGSSSSAPLSAASPQHANAAGAPPRLVSAAAVGTRSIGTALWALGRLDAALQPRPAMELLRFTEAHFKVTHANHLSPCCHDEMQGRRLVFLRCSTHTVTRLASAPRPGLREHPHGTPVCDWLLCVWLLGGAAW